MEDVRRHSLGNRLAFDMIRGRNRFRIVAMRSTGLVPGLRWLIFYDGNHVPYRSQADHAAPDAASAANFARTLDIEARYGD